MAEEMRSRGMSRRDVIRMAMVTLTPPLWTACMDDPTAPSGETFQGARVLARPVTPTEDPTVGASWLNINRTGRDARLYVPTGYDPATPAPLLVTLHGRGGGALDWDGFQPACDERGMVMLAIDSRGVTWDRVGGSFGPDVAYIDNALERTFSQCAIDPGRVALAGFSDGASYALSLGPSNGDLFQQLIAFSPGFSAPDATVYGTPRIWVSHGRQDAVLSPERTEQVIISELLEAGYLVEYVPFEGGHEVPGEVATQALDWFLS